MWVAKVSSVEIAGGSVALGPRLLSNEDVLRELGPEAWAGGTPTPERLKFLAAHTEQELGIAMRGWVHAKDCSGTTTPITSTLDLAELVAERALVDAGLSKGDVGWLLCTTSTPPRWTTSLASLLGGRLGIRAPCFDLRAGCAGGLFALGVASSLLALNEAPILLVASETFSKVIPKSDKLATLALGDGAAALVLRRGASEQLMSIATCTDGALSHLITTVGELPPTRDQMDRGAYTLSGDPETMAKEAIPKYLQAIKAVLESSGWTPEVVDRFVPHQTNTALMYAVAERAGFAAERVTTTVGQHANVGVAGSLVALLSQREGERVVLAAVGGGLSWAAVAWPNPYGSKQRTLDPLEREVAECVSALIDVADLEAPLELDSMRVVELVETLEQRFDIRMRPRDVTPQHFGSVRALVKLVRTLRGGVLS